MSTTVTVASADAGKLLLRLTVGILVLLHGLAKVASGPAFVVGLVAIALVHMGELFTLGKSGGWALELQGMFLFTALAVAMTGPGRYVLTRS